LRDRPNIRAERYYLARCRVSCESCAHSTPVFALAVPCAHETLDEDAEAGTWQSAGAPAYVFLLAWIAESMRRRLATLAPTFQPLLTQAGQELRWANHCQHCGVSIDDELLHCEPGVFMPWDEVQASGIEFTRIAEALEVSAAGYAPDAEFVQWQSIS